MPTEDLDDEDWLGGLRAAGLPVRQPGRPVGPSPGLRHLLDEATPAASAGLRELVANSVADSTAAADHRWPCGRSPRSPDGWRRSGSASTAPITAGDSDADIAARHGVALGAVVRRRRQSRLLRPPPNKVRPPISRDRLVRQLATGKTRADIATAHNVGLATVTRWCTHYGIDVVGPPRPARGHGVELDGKELRRLYVGEQWTAKQIGSHFGVDPNLVTFALHSHRIPVRHGANGSQADAVVLLDALYADPDVVAVLEQHRIPLRRRAGRLASRFPQPAPLAAGLVDRPVPRRGAVDHPHLAAHRTQHLERLRGTAPPRHPHPTEQPIPLVRPHLPVSLSSPDPEPVPAVPGGEVAPHPVQSESTGAR